MCIIDIYFDLAKLSHLDLATAFFLGIHYTGSEYRMSFSTIGPKNPRKRKISEPVPSSNEYKKGTSLNRHLNTKKGRLSTVT